MSTFVIAYPNKIKGHGSSGCPIVFYVDGFPHLLGMHTISHCENKFNVIKIKFLENTSTILISELIERQILYDNLDFKFLLDSFLKYNIGNRDNYKEKHFLWMIANHLCGAKHLCRINENVKSRKEINKFCKYNYY